MRTTFSNQTLISIALFERYNHARTERTAPDSSCIDRDELLTTPKPRALCLWRLWYLDGHSARAESFMKTLKVEEVNLCEYETFADVVDKLPGFIAKIYNTRRLHSALGYRTPEEFETQLAQQAA